MCRLTRKPLSDRTNTTYNRRLMARTTANVDISIVPEHVVEYVLAYLNIGRLQGRDVARIIRELLGERDDAKEE